MTLAMTRPWKHPKTGMFWQRKCVPDDLRDIIGKREEKRSLKTKNAAEAKLRLAHALAELETMWANLMRGPVTLSEVQANLNADQAVNIERRLIVKAQYFASSMRRYPSEAIRSAGLVGAS
jgi:hypothetical protein